MKDMVKQMWTGILSGQEPTGRNQSTFIPSIPEDKAGTFIAYLTVAHNKGIYSTERGQRGFAVKKEGEAVDEAWSYELGTFEATTHTAFEEACELFADQKSAWLDEGVAPEGNKRHGQSDTYLWEDTK